MELIAAVLRLLVIALGAGVTLYLALFLFQRLTPGIDEWAEVARGNAAAGLLMGAVALSAAVIIRPIVAQPLWGLDLRTGRVVTAVFLEGIRLLLGMLVAVGAVTLAAWLYNILTRGIVESTELRLGNVAVGLVQSAVILSTALLLSEPAAAAVRALLEAVFR